MSRNQQIYIDIRISAEEMMKLYQGVAQNVSVRARDGRRVQFPASSLRPYVTSSGVEGSFILIVDAQHKLQSISRLGAP